MPLPSERNAKGHFLPGWRGGPGGSKNTLFIALKSSFTKEDILKVGRVMYKQALKGNMDAIRLFFAYTVGVPKLPVEISKSDDEFRVAGVTPAELNRMMLQRLQDRLTERAEREKGLLDAGVVLDAKTVNTTVTEADNG